jgi:hypothetical protein
MKDYIIQQLRESSTWRGLIDIVVGVFIEFAISSVTFLSSELTLTLHAIAFGFIARGGVAVAAKDTTTAGTAVKVAQAQAAVDEGKVTLPADKP